MSYALLLLGLLVFLDTLREPGLARQARAGASFTAAGARFGSAGARLLLVGLGLVGTGLLGLGAWAAAFGEKGGAANGAGAVGFGLFLLACGIGGPPREADVHFGRTEVRVGLRRIPYERFHRFEVDEGGRVTLEGAGCSIGGRVGQGEVQGLRSFLADRVFRRTEPSPGGAPNGT
ncbi:MAG TPA: hypothetical protein VFI25_04125 [Planctomycetota bacterium]|nr:hypothetical protein [Planctomycetota bacterium]